ncbi:hypothetical protein ACTRXD_17685 [Nitrospira sp. T9]
MSFQPSIQQTTPKDLGMPAGKMATQADCLSKNVKEIFSGV